jgi:secondary thiamine-phosphate synthase enzyme
MGAESYLAVGAWCKRFFPTQFRVRGTARATHCGSTSVAPAARWDLEQLTGLRMRQHQETIEVRPRVAGLTNITATVAAVVARSRVVTGLCTVFVQHTSASLVIQENADPAVLRDLQRFMADLVPELRTWEHADEGPDDMPAHVRSVLTKTAETIPITSRELALGTWQGIYLWEHRAAPHARRLVIHVLGE